MAIAEINNIGTRQGVTEYKIVLTEESLTLTSHIASSIKFELHKISTLEISEGISTWGGWGYYKDAFIRILGETTEGMKYNYKDFQALVVFFNPNQNSKITEFRKIFKKTQRLHLKNRAVKCEKALDYESAISIWEQIGDTQKAKEVREKMLDSKASKTIVHGDYVDDRDTIIQDSVVSKSNVGAGGKTKAEKLREVKALLDDGIIDDDDYEKMKREIIG